MCLLLEICYQYVLILFPAEFGPILPLGTSLQVQMLLPALRTKWSIHIILCSSEITRKVYENIS